MIFKSIREEIDSILARDPDARAVAFHSDCRNPFNASPDSAPKGNGLGQS